MAIILKPEQDKLLIEAANSGLARTPQEVFGARLGGLADATAQGKAG
jgi:hypothetical protein